MMLEWDAFAAKALLGSGPRRENSIGVRRLWFTGRMGDFRVAVRFSADEFFGNN